MSPVKARYRPVLLFLLVIGLSVMAVRAQTRELTVGQPAFVDISADSPLVDFTYTLTQFSRVTIQAISEAVQPRITVLSSDSGQVAAEQVNSSGALAVELTTLLSPGSYTVRINAVNEVGGSIIVVVQREIPIAVEALQSGAAINASVSPEEPTQVYSFEALTEPAYLFVDSHSAEGGVLIRLVDVTSGTVSALVDANLSGARLTIPASTNFYQLQISHSGRDELVESFDVCLTPRSMGSCQESAPVVQPPSAGDVTCFVTPSTASGANIRQSADTSAAVLLVLPPGETARVIGIAPDGSAYQVTYASVTGWIAAIAVDASGDCGAVTAVNPPLLPAAPPTQEPPPPAAPTQPPAPVPTATASGPCLITITSPTFVYVIPVADISNLYDQPQAGYELIPIGRLADDSWWHTNYGMSWIETVHFGVSAVVSGDCSGLPVVAAP